jgi:hypothetical protein
MLKNVLIFCMFVVLLPGCKYIQDRRAVAVVGGSKITAADFLANARSVNFSDKIGDRRRFLDDLIDTKCMILLANQAGHSISVKNSELATALKPRSPLRFYVDKVLWPQWTPDDNISPDIEKLMVEDKMKKWRVSVRAKLGVQVDEQALAAVRF